MELIKAVALVNILIALGDASESASPPQALAGSSLRDRELTDGQTLWLWTSRLLEALIVSHNS